MQLKFDGDSADRPDAESSGTLPLQRYLNALHRSHHALRDGTVATYIPELAKADPDWFGISVVTVDGYAYTVGDSDRAFTIQSISKPVVYAAALADRGRAGVLRQGERCEKDACERGLHAAPVAATLRRSTLQS